MTNLLLFSYGYINAVIIFPLILRHFHANEQIKWIWTSSKFLQASKQTNKRVSPFGLFSTTRNTILDITLYFAQKYLGTSFIIKTYILGMLNFRISKYICADVVDRIQFAIHNNYAFHKQKGTDSFLQHVADDTIFLPQQLQLLFLSEQ